MVRASSTGLHGILAPHALIATQVLHLGIEFGSEELFCLRLFDGFFPAETAAFIQIVCATFLSLTEVTNTDMCYFAYITLSFHPFATFSVIGSALFTLFLRVVKGEWQSTKVVRSGMFFGTSWV
jgi:hypothetical protein